MSSESVLILDDDADVGIAARLLLQRSVGPVQVLRQPGELVAALATARPAVLLLDMNFSPGCTDGEQGLELLQQTMARPDAPVVVVMTAYAHVEVAVRALKPVRCEGDFEASPDTPAAVRIKPGRFHVFDESGVALSHPDRS